MLHLNLVSVSDPASGLTQDFGRGLAGALFSFTPELRDRDSTGAVYGFEAPDTEIQPSFEEMWNGFVAMFEAIDDFNERSPLSCGPEFLSYCYTYV